MSGIALATVFAPNGWIGALLEPLGIQVAYTWVGVVVALTLIGLPFVVRSVQPALEEVDVSLEEAAESLGASRWMVFRRVILPTVLPSLATGFTLALARAVGEYGSVIFIAGNLPLRTEITPLLIVIKLEQYDYLGAAALGLVMLVRLVRHAAVDQRDQRLAHSPRGGEALMAGARSRSFARGQQSPLARVVLIALSVLFLATFLIVPVVSVLGYAFSRGLAVYLEALHTPDTLAAIRLTLTTAAIVVPVNTIFGVAAAWAIAKFDFRGKQFLITLIDLPFSVSPVIAGLVFVLLFGAQGWFGPFFRDQGIQIVYALPGIVLATMLVTFPYVARELIPIMQMQGREAEEAAVSLGAGGWMTFFRVTLPSIRWGLLYGVILCNARAMGEFGAVAVVSGHIRGLTTTMPLQAQVLYDEYDLVGAFAVASLLMLLALLTLIVKTVVEAFGARRRRA